MSENVDELKKKVLELRDVIDKQNDYIKKYQIALLRWCGFCGCWYRRQRG